MTVWAPAELAVMFRANPHNPIMPLRITKVFDGLVQVKFRGVGSMTSAEP